MRLDEYAWSHNPRGMHNALATTGVDPKRYVEMKLGWCKLVAVDREYTMVTPQMLAYNITPIVRLWRPRFGASAYNEEMVIAYKDYIRTGVKWFEFYNEPNLDTEWPMGILPDYNNVEGVIAPIVQNWLDWAAKIIDLGAYPAFPALAEAVGRHEDVTGWLLAMMTYLADNYYDRFREIANNGMWVATHPYIYNHFYQEGSGARTARAPEEQRADEGGWHFEYPYDPITQANDPGLTPFSGGPNYPRGDPVGLTGMGHAFIKKFQEFFGGGAIPIVGTEGGITPVPDPGSARQLDTRFPPFNWASHGEATLAMFNWIAQQGPPWMFGLTLWKENDYFESPGGLLPAVLRLRQTDPIYKNVPPIEALEGPGPRVVKAPITPIGPGPIHGSPDYHFLIIAPGFNTNWFFQNARDYWERFRPTLITAAEYIAYLPYAKSLAVTVLTTPELADYMSQQIKDRWPTVWFDLIVGEREDDIAKVLKERAANGRRFG